jgi:hypothetical protein
MTLDDLEKCVSGETVLQSKTGSYVYMGVFQDYVIAVSFLSGGLVHYHFKECDISEFTIKKQKKKLYAYWSLDDGEVKFYTHEADLESDWKRFSDADREL